MHRRVSKTFVEEASSSVKPMKIFLVCFTSPEVQATDLEIRKELAVVVFSTTLGINQPVEICFSKNQMWVCCYESIGAAP
jgi:hypothetical protein